MCSSRCLVVTCFWSIWWCKVYKARKNCRIFKSSNITQSAVVPVVMLKRLTYTALSFHRKYGINIKSNILCNFPTMLLLPQEIWRQTFSKNMSTAQCYLDHTHDMFYLHSRRSGNAVVTFALRFIANKLQSTRIHPPGGFPIIVTLLYTQKVSLPRN